MASKRIIPEDKFSIKLLAETTPRIHFFRYGLNSCKEAEFGKSQIRQGVLEQDSQFDLSYTELQAPNHLHLPVICAMEIPLCGADIGMAHSSLDGSKVITDSGDVLRVLGFD